MAKGWTKATLLIGAAAVLALTGIGQSASPPANAPVPGRDWFSFGGDDNAPHYSALTQINAANVSQLGLAWSYDLDTYDGYTEPLAVNGVVYFAVGSSVIHALDARTGTLLWQYDPLVAEQPAAETRLRAGWGIRGIAYRDGKVFTGTRDGRLIAVDAKTGKLLWSVDTLDEEPNGYITGPPFVAGDNVVIGHGGSDYDVNRGYVTAYNIKTGKKSWRFFTVPGDPSKGFENKAMEMAAKTWKGEWWKYGGGGSVWHAMAYDAKYDRVYLGTGNGYPWNEKIRSPGGGDNLFLASIVALDAKTGEYVWHYQTNPGVTWDFNNAMDIQLTDLKIDGKVRPVLLHAPKNGFYYVIDRENGKLLSAEKFAQVNWADKIDMKTGRPIENPEARYVDKPFLLYPFPNGAHGVQAMSTSLQTKLTYIPVMEGARWHADPPNLKDWKVRPGMMINTGLGPTAGMPVPPTTSKLVAWDPVAQKEVWSQPQPGVFNGGILSTGGNLIFQGQNTGQFVAYSADKGQKLWSFDAQNGILGAPISYTVGGKQYVTVIASFRASYRGEPNWDYRQQKRRVLTFMIGGTQKLPPNIATEEPIQDDPDFVIDPAKVTIGTGVYNSSCMVCHGVGTAAGGAAPDLRQSSIPLDADAFKSVLHDGALMARGMGKFANLSDEELEGLRHMIRQRAREALQKK